ncbi:hypothetical protein [Paenibacillus sp. Marseille-Q4541]|uniref:hypothetical protein n=1 Tax=Paenibacillus sp. Marseille-Q4541 TaxID=2831522 RepID=UPI001BA623F5|nr:hypothetical protein [Paenibacillus sp. Marseille-Q4541]
MEYNEKLELVLIEKETEYLVSFSIHPDDWIARFDKSLSRAREWASNMVELYNNRFAQEIEN